jgi:signal transduction histidine kinase
VRVSALGEAATQLPWLSPCAASLVALARCPAAAAWEQVRHDPAAVALILRSHGHELSSPATFSPALLRHPGILTSALRFLTPDPQCAEAQPTSGFVDWNQPGARPIYGAAISCARAAERLAELTGQCDPENAWIAGLLAPLGWMSICAIAPEHALACLLDSAFAENPLRTQQRHWGFDHAAIARRLLLRWGMPGWLTAVAGYQALPAEIAQALGAEPKLFRIVQLAVALVGQHNPVIPLAGVSTMAESAAALGLSGGEQEKLKQEMMLATVAPSGQVAWQRPESMPLLRDLLEIAVENRRLSHSPALENLEHDRDLLSQALQHQRSGETERLQGLKLQALAEFAAGAAHEINNPLAVISGQAQYLLSHEGEPGHQRALQTIIGQTQRVHQVLSELMQFARPARPQRQIIDFRNLVREVTLSLSDLAIERQVQIVCPEPTHAITLYADPRQIRTALECLLRNAIEAAPAGGWASLRVESSPADCIELIVEDSGTGPAPAQRDHLFDPFFSGRQAGRGRGLGLPTAWRLAREHGGDVRFDDHTAGPTRFVLSLPRQMENNGQAETTQESHSGNGSANGCGMPAS